MVAPVPSRHTLLVGKGVRSFTSPPRQGRQSVVPGGPQNARMFVRRVIFEALLVFRFSSFSYRALRKWQKTGSQKASNRPGYCDYCGYCIFLRRFISEDLQ